MRTKYFALLIALLVFLIHGRALGIFYIQDDAYAYLASEHWWPFYKGIATDLQYRPNAYLLTHLIDLVFPDKPWPLKLAGLSMLIALGTAFYDMLRRLGARDWLAGAAALLLVVHPGYYSLMNLYLSAAMTGLGLLCVMIAVTLARRRTDHPSRIDMIWTLLALVACLTSYEAAIIALPLMMLTDLLYRPSWSSITWRTIVAEGWRSILRYAPHIILTIAYLYARKLGVERVTEMGQGMGYDVTASAIAGNLSFQLQNLLAQPIIATFAPTPFSAWWPLALLPVAALAFHQARQSQSVKLWLLSVAWLILGFLPFVLVGKNGHVLHYVFYAIPGFAALVALCLNWLRDRCPKAAIVVLLLLLALGGGLNSMAYRQRVLTAQAYAGQNIVTQFEAMPFAKTDRREAVLMNLDWNLAAWIQFGETINIDYRDKPFTIDFPQSTSRRTVKDPVVLYAEHLADDVWYDHEKLIDVTDLVHKNAPWRNVLSTWKLSGKTGPLSLQTTNQDSVITLTFTLDGQSVACTGTGALALPPSIWHDAKIEIAPTSSLKIKDSFELPEGKDFMQSCSETLFP